MARTILWAYGFDHAPAQVEAEVEAIGPLPFDTVILPFIHVQKGNQLVYNDTPIEKLWDGLPAALEKLKSGFPVKKRLLMSVGPFQSDFDAIGEDYEAFVSSFIDFAKAHHIDGMDLDYEGDYGPRNAKLLALMVNTYRRWVPDGLVTAAPYTAQDFWAGEGGVLSMARNDSGHSNFSWFNVQFYAGAGNLPPQDYPANFDSWAAAAGREGNGVSDPQDFIAPGCNGTREAERKFSPKELEEGLSLIRREHSSIGGGFVWNYEDIEWTPGEWAEAIVNGCR